MGRTPLPIETWGRIRRTTIAGVPTAVAYYRDSDGRTRKAQRTGKTPADAENRLRRALRDRLAPTGETITRESPLSALTGPWLDELRAAGRAPATLSRYAGTIRAHLTGPVGEVRIREATVPRLQRVVDRVAETAGPSQGRMLAVVLTGMLELAVRYGAAQANAAEHLRLPSTERDEVRAPTVEEVRALRALMAAYDARPLTRGTSIRDLADVTDMLLATGARIGEVLALRWTDIDIEAGKVTINATVIRGETGGLMVQERPKSSTSRRILTVPPFAVDLLVRRRVSAYCEWVFPSAVGTARWPENVRTQWVAALAGSELSWMTPKSCRKAVATLLKATEGVEAARVQLGHGSAQVTEAHYIQRPTERPDVSSALARFVENSE
ncbi:MAG: site-specific integrase [Microbacteriaceae bacterium]